MVKALLLRAASGSMAEAGIEGYQLQEKLGEGSFGKVYKALEIKTGRAVAVKVVPVEQDTGEVAREIEMLKACASDNIVRYYSSFTRGSELWIVMEFCAGSSLCDVMEARSRCLTERQIGAVLAETLAMAEGAYDESTLEEERRDACVRQRRLARTHHAA